MPPLLGVVMTLDMDFFGSESENFHRFFGGYIVYCEKSGGALGKRAYLQLVVYDANPLIHLVAAFWHYAAVLKAHFFM